MAYSDLLSDARIVLTFDNNNNYTVTGTTPVVDISGTGSPTFVADAPAGIGATHSLKTNGYSATPINYRFRNLDPGFTDSSQDGIGKTFTAWVKLVPIGTWVSGTTLINGNTRFFTTQNNSGSSQSDYLQLNGSTYRSEPAGGVDRFLQWQSSEVSLATSTLANQGGFTDIKAPVNEWFHIAYTTRELPSVDVIEKVVYINGVVADYTFSTGRGAQNVNFGTYAGISSGLYISPYTTTTGSDANLTRLLSHAAFFQYPLTHEQIRAQAWYNHQNEDYQSVVLAKNPKYYARFDNPDKATNHTVLGTSASAWGPLSDDVSGFYVNEQGPANTKAWRTTITPTSNQNYANNLDPELLSEAAALYRTGEFSVELWTKISDLPTSTRTIFSLNGTNQNGFLDIRAGSNGAIAMSSSYKSGATTYVNGSILGTSNISTPSSSTAGSQLCTLHPGGTNLKNFADNQWHHVVYTMSLTDSYNGTAGSYVGNLFVDGCKVDSRAWVNTYGWVDGTGPLTNFYFGTTLTTSTLRDASVAELALYPRRLSEAEIRQNFIAGKDYVGEYGVVKYYNGSSWITTVPKVWNGTAWVDWVKKYWNGTSWVDLP